MKLFLVWGIEYHEGRTLFGIYDSMELANKRKIEVSDCGYNKYIVEEIILNANL